MCLHARSKYHLPLLQDLRKKQREKTSSYCHRQLTQERSNKVRHVSLCTWRKEFPALQVVRLASALVAVGVETRQAVHQVVVLRAGAVPTVAVLRKVAGVHGFSARGSRNSELR